MKQFTAPLDHLGGVESAAFARLAAVSSDIALVIGDDDEGRILDMAVGSAELARELDRSWIGKPWTEVVTSETRAKVKDLIKDAAATGTPRWRQLNHSLGRIHDLPVLYTALRLGEKGPVMALGRSLQPLVTLQTQLVESQQAMDREYLRLRQQETRHRLLFQISDEAVVVIDAATQRVVDTNPAALELLDDGSRRLVGRPLDELLDAGSRSAVAAALSSVLATGRQQEVPVRLQTNAKSDYFLHLALFREGSTRLLLLRLLPADRSGSAMPRDKARIMSVLDQSIDAFVVTDTEGRIQFANTAFLDAAQLAAPSSCAPNRLIAGWAGPAWTSTCWPVSCANMAPSACLPRPCRAAWACAWRSRSAPWQSRIGAKPATASRCARWGCARSPRPPPSATVRALWISWHRWSAVCRSRIWCANRPTSSKSSASKQRST